MKQLYRYPPLSEEVRARGLYVIGGGSAFLPPDTPYPPSTHPEHHRFHWRQGRVLHEYQMIYITRGSGILESKAGGRRPVRTGDLFLLFPNEWHRYSPDPATGWDEHWVAFQGGRVAQMMVEQAASAEDPLFQTGGDDLLLREFTRIKEEVTEEAMGYQSIAAASVQLILALAVTAHRRKSFQTTDVLAIIKRTKALMMEQIDQPANLEALAASLHVGYSWLRKVFRQHTGLPLAQYQRQIRLNHASHLLRSTSLPIAAIGRRSGFESAYYFARVFRDTFGCSPSQYRAQSRGAAGAVTP